MSTAHISVRTYGIIFFALMVLLGVTVGAGYVDLGRLNLVVALAIASVKAVLILLYFMHLKTSPKLFLAFFLASLYVMLLGAIILFCDYVTRL